MTKRCPPPIGFKWCVGTFERVEHASKGPGGPSSIDSVGCSVMALCQPWFRASVDQVDPSLPTAPFQPPSCIQIHRFCQKYAGNAPPGDVHAVASDRQYKVLLTIPKKIVNGWNSDTSKGFGHLVGSKHPVLRLGDVRWTKSSRHPEQQKARNGKATMPVDGAMFCLEVMPSHPGESSFDVVRPMNTEHSPFDKSSEGNLRWLDEEGAMRDWMSAVGSQDSNACGYRLFAPRFLVLILRGCSICFPDAGASTRPQLQHDANVLSQLEPEIRSLGGGVGTPAGPCASLAHDPRRPPGPVPASQRRRRKALAASRMGYAAMHPCRCLGTLPGSRGGEQPGWFGVASVASRFEP